MSRSARVDELQMLLWREAARFLRDDGAGDEWWWTSETALARRRFSQLAGEVGTSAAFAEVVWVVAIMCRAGNVASTKPGGELGEFMTLVGDRVKAERAGEREARKPAKKQTQSRSRLTLVATE